MVMSFVFSSCDFVDRSVCPEKQGRSTKPYEPTRTKYFRLAIDHRNRTFVERMDRSPFSVPLGVENIDDKLKRM